jgi:hypothetical protein
MVNKHYPAQFKADAVALYRVGLEKSVRAMLPGRVR